MSEPGGERRIAYESMPAITARTRCELLELGRAELDAVAKSHPRVREVLQEFYVKRVNTSVDSMKA